MQPIGVFDSGMGGLTVLRALTARLPAESFVYLGDTARLPYGTKSASTVCHYATQAARILLQHDVKLIVVACNTASAVALPDLQQAFAPIPVLGVVQPGAQAAAAAASAGVLVLGTESTVSGGAYARAILAQQPSLSVWSRACPLMVAMAEEARTDDAVARLVLADYLSGFTSTKELTVLLGCTHFPVFRSALERLLPESATLVDSAQTTAAVVAQRLQDANAKQVGSGTVPEPQLRFLATDGVDRFRRVGATFFGQAIDAVELVDL